RKCARFGRSRREKVLWGGQGTSSGPGAASRWVSSRSFAPGPRGRSPRRRGGSAGPPPAGPGAAAGGGARARPARARGGGGSGRRGGRVVVEGAGRDLGPPAMRRCDPGARLGVRAAAATRPEAGARGPSEQEPAERADVEQEDHEEQPHELRQVAHHRVV